MTQVCVLIKIFVLFQALNAVFCIHGGSQATPSDVLYMAGVLYDANGWCSGALVTKNYVVSGANRLQHLPIATVLLGISDIDYVEEAIAVDAIIIHEEFDPETLQNDISLLRLARPALMSDTIRPIALPSQRHIIQDFVGELGRVSGWGGETNSMEGVPVRFLNSAELLVIVHLGCRVQTGSVNIFFTNICTATVEGTPCKGDDGGPLSINIDGVDTLIGIVSHTETTGCSRTIPAIYTRVPSFLDWIADHSDIVIDI